MKPVREVRETPSGGESLKILLLSLEYGPEVSGGVGTHAREIARGMSRRGHEVEIVAYTPDRPEVIRDGGLTVHRIVPGRELHSQVRRISMVESILAFNRDLVDYTRPFLARAERLPDVVQYYNWITFPAAHELGELFDLPVLGRFSFLAEPTERYWHKTPDPEMAEQEREVFRKGSHFMAVSGSMGRVIEETHAVPAETIPVVYNGIDLAAWRDFELTAEAARRLRATVTPDGEKLVVFAGRLHPQKGVPDLLRSAALVLGEIPDVRYLVIGEPDSRDYREVIQSTLSEHPDVRSRTTFLGRLPRERVAMLFQAADVVAMPSIYEPFGWVAIEAMAAGAALVATDQGGPGEIVVDGESGFLVPIAGTGAEPRRIDLETLADRQLRLLRDEDLARSMGRAGRERVELSFSSERMLESTEAVYRRVASTRGGADVSGSKRF